MKLTKTAVENLEATGERYEVRDDNLKGFVVRVGGTGSKAFYYVYRVGKGRGSTLKRLRLGTFPTVTVEQARDLAKKKSGIVTGGGDPALDVSEEKTAPFVKEAIEIFYEEHVATKLKKTTGKAYRGLIDNHIIPAIGKRKVKDVEHRHIARLHHAMKATPYLANRAFAVVSKFFSWCERNGYRTRGDNPAKGIERYTEHARREFMNTPELAILGDTLTRLEKGLRISSQAAAAIRLLMFTGARCGEVLSLKWSYIDLEQGVARLPDSKTGFKVLQLPLPAMAALENLPQFSEFVFPSISASGHLVSLKRPWETVLKQSRLTGWRIHDLRHAFASMMVNSGASLPIVGKILGHTQARTTERYVHLQENPARKAAEEAAAKIAQAIQSKPKHGKMIPFKKVQGM